MLLLSGIDEIDICVELLADYVWKSEDNKTGLLSVGMDSFLQTQLIKTIHSNTQ